MRPAGGGEAGMVRGWSYWRGHERATADMTFATPYYASWLNYPRMRVAQNGELRDSGQPKLR
jgi:hypothetical protein